MVRREASHVDAETLYSIGCEQLFQENYEEACDTLQKACDMEPENTEYLNVYAVALMETGKTQEAHVVLDKLVQLVPDVGHEKYLYLGQLQAGQEAVASYRKGIELLQNQLEAAQQYAAGVANGHISVPAHRQAAAQAHDDDDRGAAEASVEYLSSSLGAALCALAEHHLSSEACVSGDVAQVAEDVEQLVQRAASVCPSSAEPQQVLATLRHLQGRPEEALQLLKDGISKWLPAQPKSGSASPTASSEAVGASDGPQGPWPPLQARLSAAKLLLELDETTHLALQVCETCLLEDEDNIEATYVMALALYSGGNLDEAESYVDDARIMAHEQGLLDGPTGPTDGPLAQLMDQLEDLEKAIQESRQTNAQSTS